MHCALQAFQFGAAQGYQALADAVRELGADNPFTRLVPDLSGAGTARAQGHCDPSLA